MTLTESNSANIASSVRSIHPTEKQSDFLRGRLLVKDVFEWLKKIIKMESLIFLVEP